MLSLAVALVFVHVSSLAPPLSQSPSKGFDRGFDDTKEASPVIQWYPGHIAKAEKQLVDKLKVIERFILRYALAQLFFPHFRLKGQIEENRMFLLKFRIQFDLKSVDWVVSIE